MLFSHVYEILVCIWNAKGIWNIHIYNNRIDRCYINSMKKALCESWRGRCEQKFDQYSKSFLPNLHRKNTLVFPNRQENHFSETKMKMIRTCLSVLRENQSRKLNWPNDVCSRKHFLSNNSSVLVKFWLKYDWWQTQNITSLECQCQTIHKVKTAGSKWTHSSNVIAVKSSIIHLLT